MEPYIYFLKHDVISKRIDLIIFKIAVVEQILFIQDVSDIYKQTWVKNCFGCKTFQSLKILEIDILLDNLNSPPIIKAKLVLNDQGSNYLPDINRHTHVIFLQFPVVDCY